MLQLPFAIQQEESTALAVDTTLGHSRTRAPTAARALVISYQMAFFGGQTGLVGPKVKTFSWLKKHLSLDEGVAQRAQLTFRVDLA